MPRSSWSSQMMRKWLAADGDTIVLRSCSPISTRSEFFGMASICGSSPTLTSTVEEGATAWSDYVNVCNSVQRSTVFLIQFIPFRLHAVNTFSGVNEKR